MPQTIQIQNLQVMEVVVAGPGNANRLFITTGVADGAIGAFSSGGTANQQETFVALIDPVLTPGQFVKATAMISLLDVSEQASAFGFSRHRVDSIDADWDDQSGKIKVSFEVEVTVNGANNSVNLNRVGIQVTTLAAV
ncbi:MAG: hypothetical protein H0W86_05055 [Armatimonadetes bacterium]|nr:hypothetical protein [Armatimonadota bacterium]